MEDFIKSAEVAKILGLSQNTIQQWVWQKRCPFPVYRLGKRLVRFKRDDVMDYLKTSKQI